MKLPVKSILRIGLLVVAALGVLAGVLAVNTWRFTSRQVPRPDYRPIAINEQRAAEHLSRAIQFATISYDDPDRFDAEAFAGLHKYLEDTFPNVHKALERQIVGRYSLLYTWQGSDAERAPILLMSHIDVVPVEDAALPDWEHKPFSGDIADGYIWGRGALDIKHGVLGILEAVELLLVEGFQPAETIYLAFGEDEEVGGANGNVEIAALLAERGIEFGWVLDEGGMIVEGVMPGLDLPVAMVNIGEKGYLTLELRVTGSEGGHSSMPPAETAVGIVARAVTRLEDNPFPAKIAGASALLFDYVGPEMPTAQRVVLANRWLFGPLLVRQLGASPAVSALMRTTTAPTMLDAGVQDNVLPTTATAVVNFRILPGETTKSVTERVRRTIADDRVTIEARPGGVDPPPLASVTAQGFKRIERTARQVFPDAIVAPGLLMATTDSRHYTSIARDVYRFIPARLSNEDISRIHGTNERISIAGHADVIRFFVQLLKNASGGSP